MSSIHRLFDIYEICALIATFFSTSCDLHPLTLVNRQFHQSFNPLLWHDCHIVLTPIDAPRSFQDHRDVLGRETQQPTAHALARWGHLIRHFKVRIVKANVSTFILDLMQLHARHLVSVTIESAFMSADDYKEQVMGLASIMMDFDALCRNDLADDSGDAFYLYTDRISTFDHGLMSPTITSLKLELEPTVVREILPAMIAARKQDDRVLAGLTHFQLECEHLYSQTEYEIIRAKSLPLSAVHAFLDAFPKLETLCTSFMLIMEDDHVPTLDGTTLTGQGSQGASPRLQSLTMTPHSPRVLASLLARASTTISTHATITSTIDTAASTARGLRELKLTCYRNQPLLPTLAEGRLSSLEHFSYWFVGQPEHNTVSNRDQDWIALWKSVPQLRSLSTHYVIFSSQVSRSLVAHCPRLKKVSHISLWREDNGFSRNPGWGSILEIFRGDSGLNDLQFNQYVDVRLFHRMIRHPTPLLSLLSEGSRNHSSRQSTMVEQSGGQEVNHGAGAGYMTDLDEDAVHGMNNMEVVGPLSHDLRSETEEHEEDDEDDHGNVYIDDSDDTGISYYEGDMAEDEDEEDQERESISQCISDVGCFNSLEFLWIHRLSLNGPTENHIFRQAIRLLSRLWSLQVYGTGLEKWALLATEDIGLRCGMDLPKDQFIYPCLREISFGRMPEDTKDDIESVVAIMPKLSIFSTIGLNLTYDDIFEMRNSREA